MKGIEITNSQLKEWDELGYFPVSCRICDEVMLYPKQSYKKSEFIGWECGCQKRRVALPPIQCDG